MKFVLATDNRVLILVQPGRRARLVDTVNLPKEGFVRIWNRYWSSVRR